MTTTSRRAQEPVKNIPVGGFTINSEAHKKGQYRDETEAWRDELDMAGKRYRICEANHPDGNRGTCTVPVERGQVHHSGMHLAGDGDCIIGAW